MEAHLAVKVEDEVNRDLRRDGCSPQPPHPHTRPHRVEAEKVSEQIFTLLELMSYRARWEPVYQLYCTVLYCTVLYCVQVGACGPAGEVGRRDHAAAVRRHELRQPLAGQGGDRQVLSGGGLKSLFQLKIT